MWRFLPPAFLVVTAAVVLMAGAVGDVQSWAPSYDLSQWSMQDGSLPALHDLWQDAVARFAPAPRVQRAPPPAVPVTPVVARLPATPATPASAPTAAPAPAENDALRRQLSTVEAQLAQQKQEIASLTAARDQARQDAEVLRQQRQAVATPPPPPAPVQERPVARPPKPAAPAPASHPVHAQPPAQAVIAVPTQGGVPPRERLLAARQALLAGKKEEARALMETAQLQFVFNPPDNNAAPADTINMPATWVGRALKSLQTGDPSGALHDLELAMNSS